VPFRNFFPFLRRNGAAVACSLALAAGAGALLFQWLRFWLTAPDPGSGWLAPVLIPCFLVQRWRDRPIGQRAPLAPWHWIAVGLACGLVSFARLLLEPFPGWPLAEWAYAAGLIGLALGLIGAWRGAAMARHLAFPLWFGLAALPWPTVIESGVIGRLRMLLAGLVAEACNLAGEPAVAHGTVIQIGAANLGIEEACGGIRSMQVAIIVALAAGELRRDRWPGRLGWVLGAISLALVGNGLRLGGLTWLCGKSGVATFSLWHDRLDWFELAFLLCGLAVPYLLLRPAPRPWGRSQAVRAAPSTVSPSAKILAAALLVTVAVSEASTRLWFQRSSAAAGSEAPWSARLPRGAPGYADDAFTPAMQSLLGCDAHQTGHWSDPRGARRAGYVIDWRLGQNARYAILNHNPEICLPLSGSRPLGSRPVVTLRRGLAELPFACREFGDDRGVFYVYYLAWNLTSGRSFGGAGEFPGAGESWMGMQWREVAAGRRSIAARVVSIAIFDAADGAAADQAFRDEASAIVR
jgi:exosortase/archaeosortase family protein